MAANTSDSRRSVPRSYVALAALQAGDAVACAIPLQAITDSLDRVGLPPRARRVLPPVKAASAVGLLAAGRYPALGRLTTFMLTVYFALALGAHIRVKDKPVNAAPAAALLALYAALTAKGRPR